MDTIYKVKEIAPPFSISERKLINNLFSEYWYSTTYPNINTDALSCTEKYFYLLGMVSVEFWN